MEEKYKKLFVSLETKEAPKGLEARVFEFISKKKKRAEKVRAWVFGGGSVISFGFSLWAVIYLAENIQQTGFGQYLSLLFSGDSAVYAYWKDLSLSLVESLPIVSLIIFLTAIGFFIWSFANTLKNARVFNLNF